MQKDISVTSLGKLIAFEAVKERSYFKKIFDEITPREKLEHAIIKAHGELTQTDQNNALRKLLEFSKHYFEPTTYHYPENDTHELKEATEHSIEVLTKWANKIEEALKEKKATSGFNRFIHRSVSALATRLNKIEDLGVRKEHFKIASYKINEAFFEYSYLTQDTIKKALAKISTELGVTDAIISVGEGLGNAIPQSTGVSLPLEIKHTTQIIGNIYNEFDHKTKKLENHHLATLKRVILSLKKRLCSIEKLDTRYNYLTKAKSAINKYIKGFDEEFVAIVHNDLAALRDEQAMQYKNNQYQTKVTLRNKTGDSYKLALMTSLKDNPSDDTIYVEILSNGDIAYKLNTPSHVIKDGIITADDFKETVIMPKRNKIEDFNAIKEQIIHVIAERGKTYKKSLTHLKLNIKDAQQIFDDVESEMIKQMQPARYQSWSKLCLSICLLTGRRIYEVCVTGNFEVINAHTMKITGLAKQKTDEDRENKSIEFKTFSNANLILQAITILRDIKDFSVYGDDYRKFDKATSTPLRSALSPQRENQVAMITNPAVTIKLLPKSMRQLYAAMLKYQFQLQKPNESDNYYDHELAKHLGHDAERDIETVQSYKDIVIYD
ncbi:protelomerase family protein [Fangia hongkongensis]|uniref:protelomerase family protein n=1 Tax=Fangia hongkongensis TaxID=270495 RepID=UPI00036F6B5F|nr:protelomerase family protein [Fangia hongkongensis]MBK2124830.1 hypothetical protein [Fangia hongkongensis]